MDIKSLLEGLEKLLSLMFGGQPPEWLLPVVAWGIALGFFLRGIFFVASGARKLWLEVLLPLYYRPDEKRRATRRHMFADFMESEIRRLNALEAWNDNRFAELEAEVEAEGSRRLFDFLKVKESTVTGLRKEKSLSRALQRSSERLILVEGDPGSGKSVALRHLAQHMAHAAFRSRNLKSVIPLYINLKHLRRPASQPISQQLIQDFVFKSLNRINDRDVEEFLSEEFKTGMEEGTWLFLFDSFDEIPEILSSTEADQVIRDYAEAISAFLHGMNRCRGIVASREYKGPRFLGWPKFRILPLSLNRKMELIRRTGMKLEVQKSILNGISEASSDFRQLTGNAMFLNLLCEFMNKKEIPEFPRHTHHIFNDYVWKRLQHDAERLHQRFAKTPEQVREAAEKLAYCMTADTGIGLSPTLEQLENSTEKLNLSLGSEFLDFVNAIEYLKLARMEPAIQEGQRYFTFAHRRFQEYFTTAVVLREPERMNADALLTDARWRETAVVILQTQSTDMIQPLFSEVNELLCKGLAEIQQAVQSSSEPEQAPVAFPPYRLGILARNLFESFHTSEKKIQAFVQTMTLLLQASDQETEIKLPLTWPKNLFHILGILQEGLSTRYGLIPEETRQVISSILLTLMRQGSLDDRKWALDVAGSASLPVVEQAIDIGFASPGSWVKNAAILQVSRLPKIPAKFSQQIISNLLMAAQEEILWRRRYEIYAQFSRFSDTSYLRVAGLIVRMPAIDFFLNLASIWLVFRIIRMPNTGPLQMIALSMVIFFAIAGFFIRWRSSSILKAIADTYSTRFSRKRSSSSDWIFRRFRVKQAKRPEKPLAEKLMSLVMGLIFSVGGVCVFIAITFSLQLYQKGEAIWITLAIYASFQLWALMATLEAFRLKRTSWLWIGLYFLYPLVAAFVIPVVLLLYLADQFYLISRLGVAYKALKTSPVRTRLIPFLYRSNHYAELWMPGILILWLAGVFSLVGLAASAAIWLVILLVSFEILVVIYLFIVPVIVILKERAAYHAAMQGLKRTDLLPILEMIGGLKTRRYRLNLLYAVLEKQYLVPSSENLNRLRVLIAFIQMVLSSQYSGQNFNHLVLVDKPLAQVLGYDESTNEPPSYWDEEQLDLLCKILEQMQK